jgi:tetratricopeptide (TPR) repeat protein
MRFHIERYAAGHKSVADPQLHAYAQMLTSVYDDIAREHPILEELRESAKVVALANWLRQRGYTVKLPRAGREIVALPREVPGIMYMVMAVQQGPSGEILTAAGGIDYAGDGAMHYQRDDAASHFTALGDAAGQAVRARMARLFPRTADLPQPEPMARVERDKPDGAARNSVTISAHPTLQDFAGDIEMRGGTDGAALQLWKAGDLDAAEAAYRKLIDANSADSPYVAALHGLLAQILHEKGDDTRALAELDLALRLRPDNALLLILYAKAAVDAGDLAGGIEAMKKAIALDPNNGAARQVLADIEARRASTAAAGLGTTAQRGQISALPQAIIGVAPLGTTLEAVKAGSELHDLPPIGPIRLSGHVPAWPHYEGRNPVVLEMQTRRDTLLSEERKKGEEADKVSREADAARDDTTRNQLKAEAQKLRDEGKQAGSQASVINAEMRRHLEVDTRTEEQPPAPDVTAPAPDAGHGAGP